MEKHGYRELAELYDVVSQNRDYCKETMFLDSLFKMNGVKKVLDAGCGTGTHMRALEEMGYSVTGLDVNEEMLEVAEEKVKGRLVQGDMTNFDLNEKYDAVISMYASFNHLKDTKKAREAIECFKNHLKKGGVVLLDLHNPSGDGEKSEDFGEVKRRMRWRVNSCTGIEETEVVFEFNGEVVEDVLTMRIYSIEEISTLLEETGFSEVQVYRDHCFELAESSSKNLEAFGKLK